MPASHTGFDESLLAVWQASLVLALLSITILLVLIFRRWLDARDTARRQERIAELSTVIKAALTAPVNPTADILPALSAKDYPIVRMIALNLLRSVLGADAERMVEILRAWSIEPYLRKELQSDSRGRRIQALTLLAYFPTQENMALLLKHTNETDPYVQMTALRGIALPEHIAYLPTVIEFLTHSDQRNTAMLADILQRFGSQAVPQFIELAQHADRIEMRIAAIMALAKIGDFAAVQALSVLACQEEVELRTEAIQALGQIGDVSAAPVVMQALDDTAPPVQIRAAQVAGMFRLQEAIPKLAQLVHAEDWWLRFRAAEALYFMGGAGITLLTSLSREAGAGGQMAADMLAEKGSALV